MGDNLTNHLCHADELTLISLYSADMEKLLSIYNRYGHDGIEHELVYNSLKSKVMCFESKEIGLKRYPVFAHTM